ncbi:MAG: hypothetical protein PHC61_15580 [Chitinivibrionales bacterium]|nr:hypothetical protein [Chitinivibrionales bacterium]
MKKKTSRICCDTSVIGGLHDAEFSSQSRRLIDYVKAGIFTMVISPVVEDEILNDATPAQIVTEYKDILTFCEIVEVADEALDLQQAYIDENIVSSKWRDDALHVALATGNLCDFIVSWNFKHIVNFQKIPLYNAVNKLHGYSEIQIYSPLELVATDED